MQAILASPRGFCAGVDRAIQIVERALEKFGKPVYVRHEIVHNSFVVEDLRKKGAIFVEELEEVPSGSTVIFSAHGVAPAIVAAAQQRSLRILDATCPLVSKVHYEVQKYARENYKIIVIGHNNHPEIIGTMGEAPESCILVESIQDVQKLTFSSQDKLAFVTQTTLSVDETQEIITALKTKFPHITSPPKEDICYATTNRQHAVKTLSQNVDLFLIIGSNNSSNSKRLVEVARTTGIDAHLINTAQDINPAWLIGKNNVGISSGASAPETLVKDVVSRLQELGVSTVHEEKVIEENMTFALPKDLRN